MSTRNLPLVSLRSFEAVARLGSMKTAAKELGVTPGAVSQQIKALEGKLQVSLFDRTNRKLTLTMDADTLFRTLSRNFIEIEQALDRIATGPASRKIRLKLLPSLAIRWFVPRLAGFYGKYPGFDVEVATGMPVDDLSMDDVDFACRLGNGRWKGLQATLLFEDEFVPVCSPALAKEIKRPSDLLRYPLLHSMIRMEAWEAWFSEFGEAPFRPKANISFANAALAYQAAEDGLGIAIAQRAYVTADLASGRLAAPIPLAAKTALSYYLVCTPAKAMQKNNQVFLKWIDEVLAAS